MAMTEISRPSLTKVHVQVDLLKNWPSRIWLDYGDDIPWFRQNLDFNRLPLNCKHCKRLGYDINTCRVSHPEVYKGLAPKIALKSKTQVYGKKEDQARTSNDPEERMAEKNLEEIQTST